MTRRAQIHLTALAAGVTALVLAVSSVALVLLLQRSLERSADDLARSRLQDLATLVGRDAVPQVLTHIGDDAMAQAVAADGSVLGASANLGDSGPVTGRRPKGASPELMELRGVPDDDETEDFRVWSRSATGPGGQVSVYVGMSREAVDEPVRALERNLAVGAPVVLLLATGLIWLLIGRALRPVEKAHGRQRAFVADASHELLSPLASFRSQLEVALEHPPAGGWETMAGALLADSDRMERLVRDLLYLARQDDRNGSEPRLVDLDDVVLEEVARMSRHSQLTFDTSRVSAAPVRGSREDLARLVRNLLANAERYAVSRVSLTSSTDGSGVLLTVEDDGPGVAPQDRDRLFERFYRGDPARGHEGGGSGLGLAIVKAVAERHGGLVRMGESDAGACFEVRLPPA